MTTPLGLEYITLLLCAGILLSGVLAVTLDTMLGAIVTSGLASLFAAATFVVLAAPDVAMTEAAIGSGLATLIFLYALRRTGGGEDKL